MAIAMDAHAVYGISFPTLTAEENIPEGYSHGLDEEAVADAVDMPHGQASVEQTLQAVVKLKYDKLEMSYTGIRYGTITVIYVKSSKILANAGVVPLNFTAIDAEEKDQLNALADIFGATPQWLMFHGFTEV